MATNLNPVEQALTSIEVGDLDEAHKLIRHNPSPEAALTHARLHRVDGYLLDAVWNQKAG